MIKAKLTATKSLVFVSVCHSSSPLSEEPRLNTPGETSESIIEVLDDIASKGESIDFAEFFGTADAERIAFAATVMTDVGLLSMAEKTHNTLIEQSRAIDLVGQEHASMLLFLCRRYLIHRAKDTTVRLSFRPRLCDAPHFGNVPLIAPASVVPRSGLLTTEGADLLLNTVAQTSQPAIVLVGDSIGRHNVMAFENKKGRKPKTEAAALKEMMKRGQPFHDSLTAALARQPKDVQNRVRVVQFQDVAENPTYSAQLAVIYNAFDTDSYFRYRILAVAKYYAEKRAVKTITDDMIGHAANYLLEEIPAYMAGLQIDGVHYKQILYSLGHNRLNEIAERHDGVLHQFILELQTHERHAEFRRQMIACGNSADINLPGQVLMPL